MSLKHIHGKIINSYSTALHMFVTVCSIFSYSPALYMGPSVVSAFRHSILTHICNSFDKALRQYPLSIINSCPRLSHDVLLNTAPLSFKTIFHFVKTRIWTYFNIPLTNCQVYIIKKSRKMAKKHIFSVVQKPLLHDCMAMQDSCG